MNRKYLDDLGVTDRPDKWSIDDSRSDKWAFDRELYGFDETETWCLDFSFYCWLYERLSMYLKVARIDLDFHTFEYEGEVLTQRQCINQMLEGLEIYLLKDYWHYTEDDRKKVEDIGHIWALVLPAMWW